MPNPSTDWRERLFSAYRVGKLLTEGVNAFVGAESVRDKFWATVSVTNGY